MLLVFFVAGTGFISSLRSKMGLNGKLYNKSSSSLTRRSTFFIVRKLERAQLTPKEKSHRRLSMAFLVAGTGLEPVTFGL
jgi:hypothetical protein